MCQVHPMRYRYVLHTVRTLLVLANYIMDPARCYCSQLHQSMTFRCTFTFQLSAVIISRRDGVHMDYVSILCGMHGTRHDVVAMLVVKLSFQIITKANLTNLNFFVKYPRVVPCRYQWY